MQRIDLGISEDVRERVLAAEFNYGNVKFGSEARKAELFTEITVGDTKHEIIAGGVRGCSTNFLALQPARGTAVYGLTCNITYFHAPETSLGPVTIIDDPRRTIEGSIILRRSAKGEYQLPGLSSFSQYLIFNVGEFFFYYPSPWVVIAAITQWPPDHHQYHHLEEDTPIYDFNTREPNVARKGISTISILDPLSREEERSLRDAHARQVDKIKSQPGYKVAPEDFLKK